jgi:hypothetical protein
MRSPRVVVPGVLGKRPAEVSLAEDQHAVGEFGSDGQHEAFGLSSPTRCPGLEMRPPAETREWAVRLPARIPPPALPVPGTGSVDRVSPALCGPRPATRTELPADALLADVQPQRPQAEGSAQVVARVEAGEQPKPHDFSFVRCGDGYPDPGVPGLSRHAQQQGRRAQPPSRVVVTPGRAGAGRQRELRDLVRARGVRPERQREALHRTRPNEPRPRPRPALSDLRQVGSHPGDPELRGIPVRHPIPKKHGSRIRRCTRR